jgi:hypothetical protein
VDEAETQRLTLPKALKTVSLAAVSYVAAAVAAGLGVEIASNGSPDVERALGIAMVVGVIAFFPVVLVKLVMGAMQCDGPVAHLLAGGGVGIWSSVLILGPDSAEMVMLFAVAGALAGSVYWCVRSCGRRVLGDGA